MYGLQNQFRTGPMFMGRMGGCNPGMGGMVAMVQMMQLMQLMQMSRQFSGGTPGMQFGGQPNCMCGPQAQNLMTQPQQMPWNTQQMPAQQGGPCPAYLNSNGGPCDPPFGAPDEKASPIEQLQDIRGWSQDNDGRNGISPYTSLQQDTATTNALNKIEGKSSEMLLDSCKSHPAEKPVQKEIWEQVLGREMECKERGETCSSDQKMMWNSQLLAQAAAEGKVSPDTGARARDYLKIANATNQALTDTFLKGGQQVPQDLQRYVSRSQFNPQAQYAN